MAELLDDVRRVAGVVPGIFQHMDSTGALEQRWPTLRHLYRAADIPRPHVLRGILAALTLRCAQPYCFVVYGCRLRAVDVRLDPCEIAELYIFPAIVPEHRRWSRVLELLVLLDIEGPHQRVAEHALRQHTSAAEFESLRHLVAAAHMLMGYSSEHSIDLDEERELADLPASVRAQVPEFVRFHGHYHARARPEPELCGGCRKLKTSSEEGWVPLARAAERLPVGVSLRHALCPGCELIWLAS